MILAELITYPQAIILGLLQGVSELFPISSLGHSVILPKLLGWDIHQNDNYFLTFLVATHFATALVLLGFFCRDWVRIVKGLGRSLRDRGIDPADADARLGWLLVVGTIPAGILGLAARAQAAVGVRVARGGGGLPDPERRDAVRRRAAAPARPADRRRRRHADRAPGELVATPSGSARRRRWR